ncbi:MAG: stage III sporulation protein AF [Lachnospiraceae bacterium]|nr:stage III sporulation protein AF [Lachnospiraceae bacterium]
MAYFYQWIKNIVFFYILMTAVLHLLPQSSYRKYLRFFGGLVVAVLLLHPLLDLMGREEELLERIFYESFWQDMETAALDMEGMEEWQWEAYQGEFEKAIANDIAGLVPEEFTVKEIRVQLSKEGGLETMGVASLELYLQALGGSGSLIGQFTRAEDSSRYPGLKRLRDRLEEFYQLSGEQLSIYVQEESS